MLLSLDESMLLSLDNALHLGSKVKHSEKKLIRTAYHSWLSMGSVRLSHGSCESKPKARTDRRSPISDWDTLGQASWGRNKGMRAHSLTQAASKQVI